MPKLLKRFVVVMVNGQLYEVERPVGVTEVQVCVEFDARRVVQRVWIEPAYKPAAPGMANPYTEGSEE